MFRRKAGTMIYAIEFQPQHFKSEHLENLKFLPNLEQIQLSGTKVTDQDMELLVELPKLDAIELNQCNISDRGIEILSRSASIRLIVVEGREIYPQEK